MRQFIHPDFERQLVRSDGEPAGAAASVITDGVLGICGHRHAARVSGAAACSRRLSPRRSKAAIGRADLAMATAEPGSISQRTFERFGFQVLYTRAILLRT